MVVDLEGVGKTVGIIIVVLCIIVPCVYCLIISIAMYCGQRMEDFLEDQIWTDNGEYDLIGPDTIDYGTDVMV